MEKNKKIKALTLNDLKKIKGGAISTNNEGPVSVESQNMKTTETYKTSSK